MPITPYSTPIQFEYKPLGLEGFAKPLSEMQNQYDATLNKVDELDFKIQSLSKDDPAAKELIASLNEKRNQLRDSLMNTKNYKEGARKVLSLNREYSDDPRIQSIQQQAKAWQEADKEHKERYLKGDISQKDYENWRNVTMGEYQGYDKGSINTMPLSKNEEDNIRKDVNSLLNATADQRKYTYQTLGIDEATGKKIEQTFEQQWKDKNQIAQEVNRLILTSDKYKEFYNSRADLNWRMFKLSGKEEDIARSTFKADLENTAYKANMYKSEIDKLTRDKASATTESAKSDIDARIQNYTQLLEQAKSRMNYVSTALQTNTVDINTARDLYGSQFLENKVNELVSSNADLYDYGYVKQDNNYIAPASGSGDGDGNALTGSGAGVFIPNTYSGNITNESLTEITKKLRKSIDGVYEELDLRTRAEGTSVGIFNQLFGKQDRGTKASTVNAIFQAIKETKSEKGNAITFAQKLADKGITGYDQNKLNVIYNKFSTPDGLTTLTESVSKIQKDLSRVEEVKGMQKNAIGEILKTSEYKNNEKLNESGFNYSNSAPNKPNSILKLTPDESNNLNVHPFKRTVLDITNAIINSSTRSKEDKIIAKAIQTAYNRNNDYWSVTNDDLAKAAGYDNKEDALLKGYKFPIINALKEGPKDINHFINTKMNDALQTTTYLSTLVITGDSKDAKLLRATIDDRVSGIVKNTGIDGLVPAFQSQWQEEDGLFEEIDGKPTFVGEVVGKSTISKSDRNIYISTIVKNKDTGATKTLYTLFPENEKLLEKDIYKNIYTTSNESNELGKRNKNMAASGIFDVTHPDNPLTSSQMQSLQPTAEKPLLVYSYTIDGFGDAGKIRIYKNSKQKQNEKGTPHNYFTAKRYDPDTAQWIPVNVDEQGNIVFSGGKPLQIDGNDPNGIKSKLGSIYFQ